MKVGLDFAVLQPLCHWLLIVYGHPNKSGTIIFQTILIRFSVYNFSETETTIQQGHKIGHDDRSENHISVTEGSMSRTTTQTRAIRSSRPGHRSVEYYKIEKSTNCDNVA